MKDKLGDRMKSYEKESDVRLDSSLPLVLRLDGRSFSRFTSSMKRPFDDKFHMCMNKTTQYLVKETGAKIGYCQSDEITLVLYNDNENGQVFFDGRIQKLCSVVASMCSLKFQEWVKVKMHDHLHKNPMFDCRAFTVPSLTEAYNCLIWRQHDCIRNSIQSLARHYFPHAECLNKGGTELINMLQGHSINWYALEEAYKNGVIHATSYEDQPFTPGEIEKLPEKHAARLDSTLTVRRKTVYCLSSRLSKIDNRIGFAFMGELASVSL